MAINWRLRATVFQLLAAVYAELGEEAFKGRYGSIARYFGPDASYDAIKSFFGKEISKAAKQLKVANPRHHGSGRGIPSRSSAGPSQAPPHLYFDDQDISVLTQREVAAVEARFGQSIRVPAKRPRIIKASPQPLPGLELVSLASASYVQQAIPTFPAIEGAQEDVATTDQPLVGAPSLVTLGSDDYITAPEEHQGSRKRPYSEIQDSIEVQDSSHLLDTPSQLESFGYTTIKGQHRCALCMSQLPNQQDLDRHERISKEHLRNLASEQKRAKGREKLAQVKAVPIIGRHHNTPVPLQAARSTLPPVSKQLPQTGRTAFRAEQSESTRPGTPSHTVESGSRALSSLPLQPSENSLGRIPLSEPNHCTIDKGKERAVSLTPQVPYPPPYLPSATQQDSNPRSPSMAPSISETRPTTARTEIGTLYTPQTIKDASAAPPARRFGISSAGTNAPCKPANFSANELTDVIRSTEIMVQLLGFVQREAKAVAASHSVANSSDSGVQVESNASSEEGEASASNGLRFPNCVPRGEATPIEISSEASEHREERAPNTISAPGIDVYTSMRREARQAGERRGAGKIRRKDTGSEVSFIVLE